MKKTYNHKNAIMGQKTLIFAVTSLLVSQVAHTQPSQVPLEAAFAVEPNVMLVVDTSSSMNWSSDPDDITPKTVAPGVDTRMTVVKRAVNTVLNSANFVRFCMSTFNNSSTRYGGFMSTGMQCTSSVAGIQALKDTINNNSIVYPMGPAGTPLASTLYDVTRYFRGKGSYFGNIPTFATQPIQYRCQPNIAVVVTDGEPTVDWRAPVAGSSIDLRTESRVIDSVAHSFMQPDQSTTPGHWDGISDPISFPDDWFASDMVMDDVALFARQIDMVPTSSHPHAVARSTDLAGESFDDAKRGFIKQNLKTYTIGMLHDSTMLEDAAAYGDGEFVRADSEKALVKAIEDAIVTSTKRHGSGAGATQSEIALDADGKTNLYFTQYDTADWSGDLLKVVLEEQSNFTLGATTKWSAAAKLDLLVSPHTTRKIYTPNEAGTGLLDFKRDSLPDSMLTTINSTTNSSGEYERAKRIVDYVAGDQSREKADGTGAYRKRSTILGDLIHSRATLVKDRNFGYLDSDYRDYVLNTASARPAIIYIGGNDGMLHAFDEATGKELFAFVPHKMLKSLQKFTRPSFAENHLYMVDGEFSTVDAKLTKSGSLKWSTVLASPLGAGHKGLFLLDITEPSSAQLSSKLFKWEIDNKTKNGTTSVYKRMGYMINPPKVVRFRIPESGGGFHDKWVVIAGNGVHSKFTDKSKSIVGAASVLVIDLDSGELITELVVDNGFVDQNRSTSGSPAYSKFFDGNGVTSVAAADTNADTYIDRLYAADLKGQLWRFNFNETNTPQSDADYIKANLTISHKDSSNHPAPVFIATGGDFVSSGGSYSISNSNTNRQPITGELTVTGAPSSSKVNEGEMVFFGTGQFFDYTQLLDIVNNKVQTMYAFWDRGGQKDGDAPKNRSDLQKQVIQTSGKTRSLATNADGGVQTIDYATKLGWFMDLPERGERITRKPVGLFEHMAFFTQSPVSGDPCIEGIDGWSMIAKKDTATPIEVTLASGGGTTTSDLGSKFTGDSIHDPVFVEMSDGQFVAPVVIDASGATPTVDHTVQIQKDYSRASWKRIELD